MCATVMRSVRVKSTWENFMPVFDRTALTMMEKATIALSGFEAPE
jgi:hypothetical protein